MNTGLEGLLLFFFFLNAPYYIPFSLDIFLCSEPVISTNIQLGSGFFLHTEKHIKVISPSCLN